MIETVPASLTDADATLVISPCGVAVRRLPIRFTSDDRRVITRPLIMGGARVRSMCERIDTLEEEKVTSLLDQVLWTYAHRHPDLIAEFEQNFHTGAALIGWSPPLESRATAARRRLPQHGVFRRLGRPVQPIHRAAPAAGGRCGRLGGFRYEPAGHW